MRRTYGHSQFASQQKSTHAGNAARRLRGESLPDSALQGLIAQHLGMSAAKRTSADTESIADHVLPAGWTPVR